MPIIELSPEQVEWLHAHLQDELAWLADGIGELGVTDEQNAEAGEEYLTVDGILTALEPSGA